MPGEFQFFVYNPHGNTDCYEGPYQTKDQATAAAVLNGWFEDSDTEEGHIDIEVCEGNFPHVEDFKINGSDFIDNLIGTTFEIDAKNITQEQRDDLSLALSSAFHTWFRQNHGKFTSLYESKNTEVFTLPAPDHAKKLQED